MDETPKQTSRRRFSWFQLVITIWLALLTLILISVVLNLTRTQVAVRTALRQAADDVSALADNRIEYTLQISQTVPDGIAEIAAAVGQGRFSDVRAKHHRN